MLGFLGAGNGNGRVTEARIPRKARVLTRRVNCMCACACNLKKEEVAGGRPRGRSARPYPGRGKRVGLRRAPLNSARRRGSDLPRSVTARRIWRSRRGSDLTRRTWRSGSAGEGASAGPRPKGYRSSHPVPPLPSVLSLLNQGSLGPLSIDSFSA